MTPLQRGPSSTEFASALPPQARPGVAQPSAPWDIQPPDEPVANGNSHPNGQIPVRLAASQVLALQESFGPRLTQALAEEFLPVGQEGPQPILEAAYTARAALAGVDFLTLLSLSAVAGGPQFKAIASQAGIDPARLDPATRAQVDARMRERFDQATAAGQGPIELSNAGKWLRDELFLLTA